jgi:uncharacterized LabA/DUF88 family protein
LRHNSLTLTAVLVDAGFFLKRAARIFGPQQRAWPSIRDEDFRLDLRQKGVDMRVGLDIASLAYKKQINQVVLISGDSDFAPAAKLARREGIDFVLDPTWSTIRLDLHEHIDGLRSVCPKPGKATDSGVQTAAARQ